MEPAGNGNEFCGTLYEGVKDVEKSVIDRHLVKGQVSFEQKGDSTSPQRLPGRQA